VFKVGVPDRGEGVARREPDPLLEKADKNLGPLICFFFRLKETLSLLSASRRSSKRRAWSLLKLATGSSLSLSSSIEGFEGDVRFEEELVASIFGVKAVDELAILVHLEILLTSLMLCSKLKAVMLCG